MLCKPLGDDDCIDSFHGIASSRVNVPSTRALAPSIQTRPAAFLVRPDCPLPSRQLGPNASLPSHHHLTSPRGNATLTREMQGTGNQEKRNALLTSTIILPTLPNADLKTKTSNSRHFF